MLEKLDLEYRSKSRWIRKDVDMRSPGTRAHVARMLAFDRDSYLTALDISTNVQRIVLFDSDNWAGVDTDLAGTVRAHIQDWRWCRIEVELQFP